MKRYDENSYLPGVKVETKIIVPSTYYCDYCLVRENLIEYRYLRLIYNIYLCCVHY